MPPRLEIGLCGGLAVQLDGRRIEAELAGRQGREVFSYLALHRGRPVGRDELTALLWPEQPPRTPEAALSTVLARLRRVVGHSVLVGRAQLSLELPAGGEIDVEVAEQAAVRADRLLAGGSMGEAFEVASAAAQRVAAPLLPEMQHPWVDQRRAEIDDMCARLLVTIARSGLALGGPRLDDAERAARRLIEREPFRESGYGLLMKVHSARGDVAEALLVYERLRALLHNELGVPPSSRIAALHESLLRQEPPAPPVAARSPKPERADSQVPLPDALRRGGKGRLVGRAAELASLLERWRELSPDSRRVIVVAGEPGIGKTMLAARFAAEVHDAGGTVLHGQAQEATIIPYAPLVQALRHYAVHADDLHGDADLQMHVGELGWLIPELSQHRAEPRLSTGDARLDRVRLFQAVAALLCRIASHRQTLLVLEDMHWADADTAVMLRQLLHEVRRQPVLVVMTYQDGAVDPEHPLPRLLHECRRDFGVTRLALSGLSEEALAELLADDGPADPRVVRRLCEHTSGNPLFVGEIVRSHRLSGRSAAELAGTLSVLPEGINDVVEDRLRRLEPAARAALAAAAVLGNRINLELLEEMLGDEAVDQALDAAVRAGLIVADAERGDRYRFRHALTQEAIYRSIGHSRRTNLHLRAARALALRQDHAAVGPAELAHHYIESERSEVAELAIEHACEAARQAASAHAYEDAGQHLRRALDVIAHHRPNDIATRCSLLLALGDACWRGSGPRARAIFEEALEIARRSPNHRYFAEATLGLGGRFYAPTGPDVPYIKLLEEALRSQPGDARLLTRLRSRLAEHLIFVDPGRAEQLSEAALLDARIQEDDCLVAFALLGRHATLLHISHLETRLALAREQRERARTAGEPELEALGAHWLLFDLLEWGDLTGANEALERLQQLADELGQPLYRHSALVWRRALSLLRGDLDRAAQLAGEALNLAQGAQGEEAKTHFLAQQLGVVPFIGGADRLLGAAAQRALGGDPLWSAAACFLRLHAEDRSGALAFADALTPRRLAELPQDVFWLATLVLASEVSAVMEDHDRSALLYELLEPYAERFAQLTFNVSLGVVHLPLALLAATLGMPRLAAEHFDAAAERHVAIGAPLLEARTCADYAQGVRSGQVEGTSRDAEALAKRAASLASQYGATVIAQRARARQPVAAI